MKFQVTMKDPDCLHDALREAARESVGQVEGLSEDEREAVLEKRLESLQEKTRRWFEYGEYLRVEIDTDANTCTLRACREHPEALVEVSR